MIEPVDPLVAKMLDHFDVPPLSADFAERVLAAADARPTPVIPPLPPVQPARARRRPWMRQRVLAVGAVATLGIASMSAAATGLLSDFGIEIPVVTHFVTKHLGIKPHHWFRHAEKLKKELPKPHQEHREDEGAARTVPNVVTPPAGAPAAPLPAPLLPQALPAPLRDAQHGALLRGAAHPIRRFAPLNTRPNVAPFGGFGPLHRAQHVQHQQVLAERRAAREAARAERQQRVITPKITPLPELPVAPLTVHAPERTPQALPFEQPNRLTPEQRAARRQARLNAQPQNGDRPHPAEPLAANPIRRDAGQPTHSERQAEQAQRREQMRQMRDARRQALQQNHPHPPAALKSPRRPKMRRMQ